MPNCEPLKKLAADKPLKYTLGKNGELLNVGDIKFAEPFKVNILRSFIDNDRNILNEWSQYENAEQVAYDIKKNGNTIKVTGKMLKTCFRAHYEFYACLYLL